MKHSFYKIFLATLVLLLACAPLSEAQTVKYTTESRTKLHAMGGFANVMGGNKTIKSTVFITPTAMRSDEGKNESSIVSLDDDKMIMLNHKKKNYYEMTFDQLTAFMDDARAEMDENMEEMRESGVDPDDLEFDFSVEDMGETQDIAGYKAERKLMRMEFKYDGEMTNSEGDVQALAGNLYAISDMWVAQGVDGEEVMKQFGENYAEKLGASMMGQNSNMGAMMQMFSQNGPMGDAMEKMKEEVRKFEGTALRTTTYLVTVPEGKELDINAVLNGAAEGKKKKRGGLGRLARGALRGSGINVGGGDEGAEQAQEQRVMVETETVYTAIERVTDDAARFYAPGNYKMTKSPMDR